MEFTYHLRFPAPRKRVWELLADNDRMNREIGMPAVRYEFAPRAVGGSDTYGTTTLGRLTFRYKELPYTYVRPEYYVEHRLFEQGAIREFRVSITLEPDGEQTIAHCHATLIGRSPAAAPILRIIGKKLMGDLVKAWQAFAAYLAGQSDTPYPRHRHQTPIIPERLHAARNVLLATGANPEIVCSLCDYLTDAPPEDLTLIRPFALADTWQTDRLEVLKTFLTAAGKDIGLLELKWRVLCPSCRGSSPNALRRNLSDITQEVHCPTCNIAFDANFDQSVEVCFAVAPRVRPVQDVLYCQGAPMRTPHIVAQWTLEPNATQTHRITLLPGNYLLSSPQSEQTHAVSIKAEEGGADSLSAVLKPSGERGVLAVSLDSLSCCAEWTVTNGLKERATFRIEEKEPDVPVATAALVTSLQAFRDRFSSEVLSPDTELAIRQICVLFSDLKGSTAMYQARGDAPSYRAVRDHFAAMQRIVERHNGAIVKTIGDAIMAVFTDPAQGVEAALQIQQGAQAWTDNLIVKLGLHAGPAIAVNANDRLDYFGQTVNLAARLQAVSEGNDLVIAADLAQDPLIARMLTQYSCTQTLFAQEVRGVDTPLSLLRLTLPL